jgi:hypothetical protein
MQALTLQYGCIEIKDNFKVDRNSYKNQALQLTPL